MNAPVHMEDFSELTKLLQEFPRLGMACVDLSNIPGIDIPWVDVANHIINMQVERDVWVSWLQETDNDSLKLYKLARSHMVFGSVDNVITSVEELRYISDKYLDAMQAIHNLNVTKND